MSRQKRNLLRTADSNTRSTDFWKRVQNICYYKVTPYLMVLPAMAFFLVFTIYPMLDMIALSFCSYDVLSDRKFAGLSNYDYIFNQQIDFGIALKNTLVYTVSVLFFVILGALIFAVWLQKDSRVNSFAQRIMFFPHLCASIAVAMIFQWLMDENGLFNAVLALFKLPGLRWLDSSSTAMMSVVICIFRLHPATCTVFFCHLAEQNPPPCRGCLPLHRWCKGSARSLRSGKALASKVQLVNQSS